MYVFGFTTGFVITTFLVDEMLLLM